MADKKKPVKKRPPAKAKKLSAEGTDAAIADALERGRIEITAKPKSLEQSFTAENVEKFIMGEITWAQLMGLSRDEAFSIAGYGFKLYQEARYHDARTVFEGLVLANPYESYFHNMLGAVYLQHDMKDEALSQFTRAVECDEEALYPRINRGEMYLQQGRFEEALDDLAAAVKHGSKADPAYERASALLQATKTLLQGLEVVKKQHGKT
jgi:predicted Zn-dependent protease